MINVVFLLLIFFLMTAQIAPPDPFEVALPTAERGDPSQGPGALYLSAERALAFQDLRGPAAIAAARAEMEARDATVLEVRADAAVEARAVARLLAQLAEDGVTSVALVTVAP